MKGQTMAKKPTTATIAANASMGRTTSASIGADQPQRPTRHWRHPALGKDAGFWVRFLELRTQSGL